MTEKILHTSIEKEKVRDLIASFMAGGGLIHKNEDLVSVDFEGESLPITLRIRTLEGSNDKDADVHSNGFSYNPAVAD